MQIVAEVAVTIGKGFIVTFTVDVPVQPLMSVPVTEYVPDMLGSELNILGFCWFDEKLFGPVHAQLTPGLAVRFKVAFSQIGLLLPAVITSPGFTDTCAVPAFVQPLAS